MQMQLLDCQNRISDRMSQWVTRIKSGLAMGRTDLNLVSETVLIPLLAEVFGYEDLVNLNTQAANYPGIDLGDATAGVAIQVTSTPTSEKIQRTLQRFVDHRLYSTYRRLIVYILTEKQRSYPRKRFAEISQSLFSFDAKRDVLDYRDILAQVTSFQVDKARKVLQILDANLGDGTALDSSQLTKARALLRDGNIEQAEKEILRFGREKPNTPDRWYWLSQVTVARDNLSVALEYLDRAIATDPHHAPSLALRLRLLLIIGKCTAASDQAAACHGLSGELDSWIACLQSHDVFSSEITTSEDLDSRCPHPFSICN